MTPTTAGRPRAIDAPLSAEQEDRLAELLDELRPRLFALRQMRLSHLPMDGAPWRFGYGS